MNIRVISGAFIINENEILMMNRSKKKKIAPGVWGGVGGHLEPNELNDPKAACIRELLEETGIEESQLEKLDLRYIIFRKNSHEITQIYYYIGYSKTKCFEDRTEEGKLHWVSRFEVLERPLSFEIRSILEHYLEKGQNNDEILVGTIGLTENKPKVHWHELSEWEGLFGN